MKVNDIITLWKAGYRAADIKAIPEEQVLNHVEMVKAGVDKDAIPEMLEMLKEQPVDDPKPNDDPNPNDDPKHDPDYKALYEEEKRKNQKRAANEDISGNENTKTAFDILKSFLEE